MTTTKEHCASMKYSNFATVAQLETQVSTEYQYENISKESFCFKHLSLWLSDSKDFEHMDLETWLMMCHHEMYIDNGATAPKTQKWINLRKYGNNSTKKI
jgi:hypothetical protein